MPWFFFFSKALHIHIAPLFTLKEAGHQCGYCKESQELNEEGGKEKPGIAKHAGAIDSGFHSQAWRGKKEVVDEMQPVQRPPLVGIGKKQEVMRVQQLPLASEKQL